MLEGDVAIPEVTRLTVILPRRPTSEENSRAGAITRSVTVVSPSSRGESSVTVKAKR
jgi:hypothetical protein